MASTIAPSDLLAMVALVVAVIEMQLIARRPGITDALNLCHGGVRGQMDPVIMTHMTDSP
jgi:hypothetical protein